MKKLPLLTKLAVQGILKQRTIYFPYFVSMLAIMALEYIMFSLISNEYVQTRHSVLPTIIAMGIFFSSLLAIIFIIYANNFIQRQRRKEFALYTVLGLENKHIHLIIMLEQLLTWITGSILAIGIGHALGKVMFIALNRLIQDTGASLMDYPFSPLAAIGTSGLLALILILIGLTNSLRLSRLQPSELLSQSRAGEAEPKSRWLILLLGLATLGAGYYIALTTSNVMDALMKVFIAIFLVIIATFTLLTSLSIIYLKALKRNKQYYYQPTHFLNVSSMLYRMKANATGLAGIAVLCTGIILTLGTTLALYSGMDEQIEKIYTHDFELEYLLNVDGANSDKVEEVLQASLSQLVENQPIQNESLYRSVFLTAAFMDGEYQSLYKTDDADNSNFSVAMSDYAVINATTLSDFNQRYDQDYTLAANEVLYVTTANTLQDTKQIILEDETYQVKAIDKTFLPANYVGQVAFIVMPTIEELEALSETFQGYTPSGEVYQNLVTYSYIFDASNDQAKTAIEANIPSDAIIRYSENDLVRVGSKTQAAKDLYALNGGFLFLGIIVGIVLLIGTILMLYFKQVSEGYQDQDKFEIMRKVGLPEPLIRRTIRGQIFWVFALPIIIAIIHSLAASRIMFNLLGLLAVNNVGTFMLSYGSVLIIFLIVYLIFYLITSKVYYRIIHQ